ncbi:ninjurin-2-like [Glandiceps talaboti]
MTHKASESGQLNHGHEDDEMNILVDDQPQIPTDSDDVSKKQPEITRFDANTYSGKKTITQVLFNVTLLSNNAAQLKIILQKQLSGTTPDFFILIFVLLVLSIILQLVTASLLFYKFRLNIGVEEEAKRADKMNNWATFLILAISVINVFIDTFSVGY